MKKFDLNIDRMLENWDAFHAIREIIANALDEQILTSSGEIIISCDDEGLWHIRDFGRGLRHEHFTMNENQEKLDHPGLIGKFGVGLKDALATFDRLGIEARIRSRFCDVSFDRSEKHDFSDVITLHACISASSDPEFIGTEFILKGCSAADVAKAKHLFLLFSGEERLEKNQYGETLRKMGPTSYIYINGIRVAEEENFLFSYNITSLTAVIKKALNRERTNVGRTAYSDRVKSILLASSSEVVAKMLVDDLSNFGKGTLHDEMKWTDVSVHASKITNSIGKVLFLTDEEIMNAPRFVEEARASGLQIITIPNSVKEKLSGQTDINGNSIQDLSHFVSEWNDNFEFKFIPVEQLLLSEKSVFDMTSRIVDLIGELPWQVKAIKISETMRPESGSFSEACGLWTGSEIIIKRSMLSSIESYSAVLLHELAHARSGATDVTLGFESELTSLLGKIASKALKASPPESVHPRAPIEMRRNTPITQQNVTTQSSTLALLPQTETLPIKSAPLELAPIERRASGQERPPQFIKSAPIEVIGSGATEDEILSPRSKALSPASPEQPTSSPAAQKKRGFWARLFNKD